MKLFAFFTLLFILCTPCAAQNSRHIVGAGVSYGWELFPQSYFYRTTVICAQYRYQACLWNWGALEVSGQLQVNPTHYATDYTRAEFERSVEVGFLVGVNFKVNIYKDYISAGIGGFIGPIYTPHLPVRQGGVLNFSDNLAVEINVKLYKGLFVQASGGFRHLSNAGFYSPNYGINTPWLGFGIFYKI